MDLSASEIQRETLFDAFEKEIDCGVISKSISSPEDLDKWELRRCFEILHACGTATDPTATRKMTRQSVKGFLEAIFRAWTSNSEEELIKPCLELPVEVEVEAGSICKDPLWHADFNSCIASGLCATSVKAKAKLSANPAILTIEFSTDDSIDHNNVSPLMRNDIHWTTVDWAEELKQSLQAKVFGKVRRYNKLVAIWHTRRLIKDWAKGLLTMGPDTTQMDFLDPRVAENALRILGAGVPAQDCGGSAA